MWFEEGFASSAFRSATNLTNRTYSKSRPRWPVSFPTHASFKPSPTQPPRAGAFRPGRVWRSASSAACSGTEAFQGSAASGWVAWSADPDEPAEASPPLRFGAGSRSRTSPGRRHGARLPSPGGPTRRPPGRPGPASLGVCACLPPLPSGSDSVPPHPTAGFVRQPRAGPSPFPQAPPRPLGWPHFLGAGGRSGRGTKGLIRGSSRRGGIQNQPSAVLRPPQRKKCPPEETHKFYLGGPPARPGRKGRPGLRAASPARIRKLARGKVRRTAGPCKGKSEPALPAKVNFNRGGWMRRRGGR